MTSSDWRKVYQFGSRKGKIPMKLEDRVQGTNPQTFRPSREGEGQTS